MKFLVLMGSPRLQRNTAEVCRNFIEELEALGHEVRYLPLAGLNIASCKGCYACQQVTGEYGCPQKDDMYRIYEAVLWADCTVLATPVYTWYCTAEMKAVLDRFYGMNKYYGKGEGSLWAGKAMAVITTHGYPRELASDTFETGIKRLCDHSRLRYLGAIGLRDEDDLASFTAPEAVEAAKAFARELSSALQSNAEVPFHSNV